MVVSETNKLCKKVNNVNLSYNSKSRIKRLNLLHEQPTGTLYFRVRASKFILCLALKCFCVILCYYFLKCLSVMLSVNCASTRRARTSADSGRRTTQRRCWIIPVATAAAATAAVEAWHWNQSNTTARTTTITADHKSVVRHIAVKRYIMLMI